MDENLIFNLYFIFLVSAAVLSMVIAWFVTKISESLFVGFSSIVVISLLLLLFIVGWFQSMTGGASAERIHWLFSYGLVLLLYPAYLFMNWFILKRARGVRAED